MVERSALRWVTPAKWIFKDSITLLEPTGRANIILSSEALDPSMDLEQYATQYLEALESEFRQFRQIGADLNIELRGVGPAIRRTFAWSPEGRDPVTQVQQYSVGPSRGYTSTASCSSSDFNELQSLFTAGLDSISVELP